MLLELSSQHLLFLQEIAKEENIKDYIIKINKSNAKDGIMGEIVFVTIKEKNSNKILDLVLKTAYRGDERIKAPIQKCYEREIYMYEVVFEEFRKLQEDFHVEGKCENRPKCLGINAENFNEFLALENLRESGHKIFEKQRTMDLGHIELVFKEYGRYHALSFALRKLRRKKFEDAAARLTNIFYNAIPETEMRIWHAATFEKAAKFVEDVPQAYDSLKKFEMEIMEFIKSVCLYDDEKFGVISHGDSWCNNILFKYENDKDVPTSLKFIDFQVSQYNTPIADLSHFFYSVSSGENLGKYKKCLKVYHDSLTNFLQQFKLDADEIFSYQRLETEWTKFAKYGLYMAMLYLNLQLGETNGLDDVQNDGSFMDVFNSNNVGDEYSRRIRSIIISMTANGLL